MRRFAGAVQRLFSAQHPNDPRATAEQVLKDHVARLGPAPELEVVAYNTRGCTYVRSSPVQRTKTRPHRLSERDAMVQ